jgi:hypothetical protein
MHQTIFHLPRLPSRADVLWMVHALLLMSHKHAAFACMHTIYRYPALYSGLWQPTFKASLPGYVCMAMQT